MSIAQANNIKKGEIIIEEINTIVTNWEDFALEAKVNDQKTKEIKQHLHVLK